VKLGSRVLHSQTVGVRIAPWMGYNHTFKTVKVQVLATSDNATFRTALRSRVTGAGFPLHEGPGPAHGGDRWMQDVMEPGFSSMPRVGGPTRKWHTPVTMRSVQSRGAEHYVRDEMLGADHGLVQGGPSVPLRPTMDSFGNLECSPPFTHRGTGRNYAFGRLIHGGGAGRQMNAANVTFLNRQLVQEPFEIDTSWLIVGHVDEIVSFLPHAGSTHGYKVVMADPTSALAIVRAAPAGARMMTGYAAASGVPSSDQTLSTLAVTYPFHTAGAFRGNAAMVAQQALAQAKIDGVKATLKHELDLEDSDFITFPVLFERTSPGTTMIAHSPGSVNMLVLTKSSTSVELCVPKPFGPIVAGKCRFERAILSTLAGIGIAAGKVHFIDDFTTYHCLAGEIHCGTNSEREAPDGKWWWEMDWV
jgi:protein-arginine deiminase